MYTMLEGAEYLFLAFFFQFLPISDETLLEGFQKRSRT